MGAIPALGYHHGQLTKVIDVPDAVVLLLFRGFRHVGGDAVSELESGVRFGACVTSVSGPMLRGAVAISMNASEIGSRERTYDCVCKEN